MTDAPAYVLTYQVGEQHQTVIDYVGHNAGMPKAVTDLEDAVDRTAGTDRWVRGSAALIDWLEKQRFDFRSPDAARLATFPFSAVKEGMRSSHPSIRSPRIRRSSSAASDG